MFLLLALALLSTISYADVYKMGALSSTYCPAGYTSIGMNAFAPADLDAACRLAAQVMGYSFDRAGYYSNKPPGCYHVANSNNVMLNKAEVTAPHPDAEMICSAPQEYGPSIQNSNVCLTGFDHVTDEVECRAGATMLEKNYGTSGYYSNKPKGCYIDTNSDTVILNNAEVNTGHPDAKLVCSCEQNCLGGANVCANIAGTYTETTAIGQPATEFTIEQSECRITSTVGSSITFPTEITLEKHGVAATIDLDGTIIWSDGTIWWPMKSSGHFEHCAEDAVDSWCECETGKIRFGEDSNWIEVLSTRIMCSDNPDFRPSPSDQTKSCQCFVPSGMHPHCTWQSVADGEILGHQPPNWTSIGDQQLTLKQCEGLCDRTKDCKAFDYEANNMKCNLRDCDSSSCGANNWETTTSGKKIYECVSVGEDCSFVMNGNGRWLDNGFNNANYINMGHQSLQGCQDICKRRSDCHGITVPHPAPRKGSCHIITTFFSELSLVDVPQTTPTDEIFDTFWTPRGVTKCIKATDSQCNEWNSKNWVQMPASKMGQVLGEKMSHQYSLTLASCTLSCTQKFGCHYSVLSNRNCYFYSSGCGCTQENTVLGVVSAPGSSLNTKSTCANPYQQLGHYAAMGGPGAKCRLTNCGTRVEEDTVLLNVRCCSDGPGAAGQWWKNPDCGNVYGGSKVDDAHTCKSGLTWGEANNWCTTNGARLCSKEEILNGCAKGTGCNFDFGPVWTNAVGLVPQISLPPTTSAPTTSAPTNLGTPEFYRLVQRNPDFPCLDGPGGCDKRWMHAVEKYPITCCRDKVGVDVGKYEVWYMKNWQDPVCKDVYTESDIWSMHHDIQNRCIVGTWYDGERICREAGGRLCTVEEVEHKCAISTGCNFDGRLMWTSDGEPE